jgi:hypothetical protein
MFDLRLSAFDRSALNGSAGEHGTICGCPDSGLGSFGLAWNVQTEEAKDLFLTQT